MKTIAALLTVCVMMLNHGCTSLDNKDQPIPEVVLCEGLSVHARNKNGEASVEYVDRVRRRFTFNDKNKTVKMIPRWRRFDGGMGLYEPASTFLSNPSTRWVVREELINFANQHELDRFLYEGSAHNDWVFTDDGLVIGFFSDPDRIQVNVSLYQVFVAGRKPEHIKGSRPDQISLKYKGREIVTSRLKFDGAERLPFWSVGQDYTTSEDVGLTGVHGALNIND